MKVTYEAFQARAARDLMVPTMQSDKIFFVKSGYKGGGKIELNMSSGTFTVGSGSKYLDEITEAVIAAGYMVRKKAKGWTILEIVGGESLTEDNILADFSRLVLAVESTVSKILKANHAEKKVEKRPLNIIMAGTGVGKSTFKSDAEIAAIKAKNLQTMREVTAKLKAQAAAA